jgi:hypothetical protein
MPAWPLFPAAGWLRGLATGGCENVLARARFHQQVRISNELAAEPRREAGSAHNRKETHDPQCDAGQAPARLTPLDDDVDHVRGPAAGRLILEYGDYECPFSRRAYRGIERVEEELGGGIRFAFGISPD